MRKMDDGNFQFLFAQWEAGKNVISAVGPKGQAWPTQHPSSTTVPGTMLALNGKSNSPSAASGTGGLAPAYVRAHGILMTVAWAAVIPCGVFFACFKNSFAALAENGLWFKLHRAVQMLGVVLACAGFAVIVIGYKKAKMKHFVLTHARVGLAVVVLAILQPLNAFVRPHKPGPDDVHAHPHTDWRTAWELFHKKIGYGVLFLSWCNILMAFDLPCLQGDSYKTLRIALQALFFVLVALWIGAGYCFGLQKHKNQQRQQKQRAPAGSLDEPLLEDDGNNYDKFNAVLI